MEAIDDTITDEQIDKLRQSADIAGDIDLAKVCSLALGAVGRIRQAARRECARTVRAAKAQS